MIVIVCDNTHKITWKKITNRDKNFWAPGSEDRRPAQQNPAPPFKRSLLMLWQDHQSLERIHVPKWEVVDSLFRNANVKLRRQCHLWDVILGEICLEILGKLLKIHWVIRFVSPIFMAILWYVNIYIYIYYGYPGIPWYPPCSDTPMLQKVKAQCRYVDMVENARDQVGYSWASRWLRLWSSTPVIHYHHHNNNN